MRIVHTFLALHIQAKSCLQVTSPQSGLDSNTLMTTTVGHNSYKIAKMYRNTVRLFLFF